MSVGISAFLRENAASYPDSKSLIDACMQATGKPRKNISTALSEIKKGCSPVTVGVQPHPITYLPSPLPKPTSISVTSFKTATQMPTMGISEMELRQKHDVKYIVAKFAAQLKKDIYIPDNEFLRQCGVQNQVGFRSKIASADFSAYMGTASGITYWSHPESIAKMKNEGILR